MQMLSSLQNLQLFYCSIYEALVQMSVTEDKEAMSTWERDGEVDRKAENALIPSKVSLSLYLPPVFT